EQRGWQRYWLVDPLDGTREFIKRNDEFTVNIALVEDGRAVFGLIHAPALGETGWGQLGEAAGAWWQGDGEAQAIRARQAPAVPTVTISRSHASAATVAVLDALGEHQTLRAGSALKFLRLAQGEADLYPRLGPTSEWDTAAGQCLLEAAGGELLAPDGRPFRYNQRDTLLNGAFLAVADPQAGWQARLGPTFRALAGQPS
ncbi:MAG: inositol monophosphatase family protein, partial [Lysobacterales bacterium]